MTESNDAAPARKRGGLSTMLLADLRSMAQGMGIAGAGSMKKAQLIDAIRAAQSGGSGTSGGQPAGTGGGQDQASGPAEQPASQPPRRDDARSTDRQADQQADQRAGQQKQGRKSAKQPSRTPAQEPAEKASGKDSAKEGQGKQGSPKQEQGKQGSPKQEQGKQGAPKQEQGKQDAPKQEQGKQDQQGGSDPSDQDGSSRRNRRRRGRDRDRRGREPDTTVLEDDVLVPAAGILDVLDNYAFVRTSGYLAGADDVYLSLSMVRKHDLRRGDAVVGQVRQPREGERKEKFNPMVRVDSVNGMDPESAHERPDFESFTPVHASERLRLETGPEDLVGRLVDLTAPIGKGQRGLVVAPPRSGRTAVLQSLADSIAVNHPECHLMVVLVDERPEEVTEFRRRVKGEVVASTFDRPAGDHTSVAELAIERAKRLVELGHDVVVLLDSLTRLARAYNLASSGSGRILPGGVDAAALHPPKKFFGSARDVEDGGSLTIVATALVETGSRTDEVIFEELQHTGNMELRLRGELADKRLFPAVDAVQSGTRREELLMGEEEREVVGRLRRLLSDLEPEQALDLLLERLRGAQTNIELLTRLQRTTSAAAARTGD